MALDVRIMAHSSRRAEAEALAGRLAELDPLLVWDPDPGGPPSAVRTARLAWGAPARGGATHRVVLQDDVAVPDGFAQRLAGLVRSRPDAAVGLFSSWSSITGQGVRLAAYLGFDWAPLLGQALAAPGIAMPTDLADEYADRLAGTARADRDSVEIHDFLAARRVPAIVAVPNLIQHDDPYRPSLWPANVVQGPRRSACYLPAVPDSLRGAGFGRPAAVAYLSGDLARTQVRAYDPASRRHDILRGWDYAQRIGFPPGELVGLFRREEAGGFGELSRELAAAIRYELWLTGFLSGLQLADVPGQLSPHTPPARAASRTVLSGCLRRVLPIGLLESLADRVADLVGRAVHLGRLAAREGRAGRPVAERVSGSAAEQVSGRRVQVG